MVLRTPDEIRDLFGRAELVEPGLTPATEWRPDGERVARSKLIWGGVGVIPDDPV